MSNTKQAPLPPGGTRNRYRIEVERIYALGVWADWDPTKPNRALDTARWMARFANGNTRIVARDAQGRKVVVK